MKIKRKHVPWALTAAGVLTTGLLAVLGLLLFNVGVARAAQGADYQCFGDPVTGLEWCCQLWWWQDDVTGEYHDRITCRGPFVEQVVCPEFVGQQGNTYHDHLDCADISDWNTCTWSRWCTSPAGAQPPSIWLADVCEQYYGGVFDQYGQLTVDADDKGATLYAGAAEFGPWLVVDVHGPPWVITMEHLYALAAQLGVENPGDLWFMAGGEGGEGKAQHLGSMVTDRIARWAQTGYCTPVDGGPSEEEPGEEPLTEPADEPEPIPAQ